MPDEPRPRQPRHAAASSQPAIVMRLRGGLGNQLFQYAFGRAMALRNDGRLFLDVVSGFRDDPYKRSFGLDVFRIKAELLDTASAKDPFLSRIGTKLARWLPAETALTLGFPIFETDPARYSPAILRLPIEGTAVFDGYWQHAEYFEDFRGPLIEDLQPSLPPSSTTLGLVARMAASTSVAVHVRCLRHAAAGNWADPRLECDLGYYRRAIRSIEKIEGNPEFYLFSDHPEWAKSTVFPDRDVVVMRHDQQSGDAEELWLMSKCKHFIVGNSTFSWWAAWLGADPEKTVFAPASGIGKGLRGVPRLWQLT